MRIEYLAEVGSTNEYIRRYLADGENVIVCARRQTGGRGTKGRSFLSGEGGVYLSALFFPESLPADRAFSLMTHAAVAVCRTVREFGVRPEIKWANDVLLGGKKLAGVLIENGISRGMVRSSIVGIGFNVTNSLEGLEEIAVRLGDHAHGATAERVRDRLIANLLVPSDFAEYRAQVGFLGKTVGITEGERSFFAVARDVLPDGRLLIEEKGAVRALSSAEIGVRL